MAEGMKDIINDLVAEQVYVDGLVNHLSEEQFLKKIPAEIVKTWDIKDEIIHIAFFDYAAKKLMRGTASDLMEISKEADQDDYYRALKYRYMTGEEALNWWREERTQMTATFYDTQPKDRIPWAPGLPMSAKSLVSARLMELWGHSVDICDALGLEPVVEDRIKSTLFLSWRARPNAYRINHIDLPETPIYLELTLPSGKLWTQGDPQAADYIRGSAKEWALVSVRRRNWMDTDLTVVGQEARRYASIVQTFAGEAEEAPPARRLR
ncbi:MULTISPECIES: TIGR03084 family metal-binding protein [unclassified Sporolactobacillus]|uniref:TIGR03084 family metal-binding protein n=1 Tax=unclassified Sporolactobacillus TaxID=2628533 RepID=UPI00236889A8|nr:TIGR03084 family metal-binding protein [Sporolactobacillus sp. CQH2019]MDD9146959.1 TIGR03084 family metal-binding protein [Sporolactobacillus sp. CQH2019]